MNDIVKICTETFVHQRLFSLIKSCSSFLHSSSPEVTIAQKKNDKPFTTTKLSALGQGLKKVKL